MGPEGPNIQTLLEKGVLKHFRGVGSGVTARISQLTVRNHSLPGVGDGDRSGGEGVSHGPTDLDSALGLSRGQVRHWPGRS